MRDYQIRAAKSQSIHGSFKGRKRSKSLQRKRIQAQKKIAAFNIKNDPGICKSSLNLGKGVLEISFHRPEVIQL